MQLHLKGHQFGNKAMRRKVARKQRKWAKLALAGKRAGGTRKQPNKGVKRSPEVPAYQCGPKAMALGERRDDA